MRVSANLSWSTICKVTGSIREGGAHIMCARGMVNIGRVTVGTYEGGVDDTVGVA